MEFGHGYSSIGNGDPMKDIKCGYNIFENDPVSVLRKKWNLVESRGRKTGQ